MRRHFLRVFLVLVVVCIGGNSTADAPNGAKGGEGRPAAKDLALPKRAPAAGRANAASTRLQPTDFMYQGAFRLPEDFNWGAQGLAYYPSGDAGKGSLLVTGPDQRPVEYAEVSIPTPSTRASWLELPCATMLGPLTEFDGDLVETQLDPATTWAGGIEYVVRRGTQTSDKIYGSVDYWYSVTDDTFPVVWFSEMNGSNPRGLFHVGPQTQPYHGNKQGDYLFSVPGWYADRYLGGRTLVTGKCRGAFGGSMGPALFAFRPWDSEDPSGNLDAVPMLWYRLLYPDCAGPNVGDKANCDFPEFTMCDDWLGASFVEAGSKQAIVLLGVKGLGSNGYGPPPSPDACNPYQGYHCDPMERQVIFYDVDELGQVAQGARDAWTIDPYTIWRPTEFFLGDEEGHTCGEVGGMAYDSTSQRVFMIEKGLGPDNSAVIHVWIVAGGSPTPPRRSHLEFLPLLLFR